MGRNRIENPTRKEKEKSKKLRSSLYYRAKAAASEGADVFVVVRFYNVTHVFKSSSVPDWPLHEDHLVSDYDIPATLVN
jgi:hypothetical protein